MFLRQSTASQSVAIGPFIDDTDFKTPETALTINNTDIKLVVNGGASANKNSGGGTHRVNGVYGVTFDATDTATVGEVEVSVVVSGALPVFHKFQVVEEAVYDALFAGSALGYVANATVNVAQISGDSAAADNAEAFFDGTGYAGTNNVIPTVTTVTNQVTANVTAISGDTAAADNLEAAADGTGYNLGGGAVVAASVTGNVGGTVNGFTAVALADFFDTNSGTTFAAAVPGSVVKEIADNAAGGSLTESGIADAVWDEAIAGHASAGSTGEALSSGSGTTTIRPVKNAAFSGFMFPMFDSTTKAPKTGLTVTATRAIDGGSFAPCTNSPTEIGGGVYAINFSASDLNGDKIMFLFTASDADVQLVEIFTQG